MTKEMKNKEQKQVTGGKVQEADSNAMYTCRYCGRQFDGPMAIIYWQKHEDLCEHDLRRER